MTRWMLIKLLFTWDLQAAFERLIPACKRDVPLPVEPPDEPPTSTTTPVERKMKYDIHTRRMVRS